jgi:hypothetical protein
MNMNPEYSETWNQRERTQMEDLIMVCIQCEEEFQFSVSEQKKYEDRGYDIPKRCPSCRKHKSRNSDLTEDRRHSNRKRGSLSKHMNEEW